MIESEIPTDLLPTPEEVEFYKEHGYYASKKIFSDEQLDQVVEATERFYAGEVEPCGVEPIDRFIQKYGPPSVDDWGNQLRKNDYASFACPALGELVRSPVVGAIAARLSGSPEIRLWHDQLLFKPPQNPGVPSNVGWHADLRYWMLCTSKNMLTAWIPFHDVDEEIGSITMIDGSHKWNINFYDLDFFDSNLDALEDKLGAEVTEVRRVPMELKKGQVSFHHCLTLHGSGPNHTDKPRRSVAVHLQDATNDYREHVEPDGNICWHYNVEIGQRKGTEKPDFKDPEGFPVLYKE